MTYVGIIFRLTLRSRWNTTSEGQPSSMVFALSIHGQTNTKLQREKIAVSADCRGIFCYVKTCEWLSQLSHSLWSLDLLFYKRILFII